MNAFDAAGFLVSLLSMSLSVSLLLGGLALCKVRLLTRYRARTLYLLGLLLTALLLCPWRPALLLPKITLPAAQVAGAAVFTEDASLFSMLTAQASDEADNPAVQGTAKGVSAEAATKETSGDMKHQAKTSQSAASSANRAFNIPWAWVLLAVWAAGTITVLLLQTIRHARFLLLIRRWQSPVPQDVQAALSEQSACLGITPPPAFVTPCVQSPTVAGLLRPMLLLPAIEYDKQQLSLMLTHELIHYKHGHLWGKALGYLVSAAHWFNPLMPFLMREMSVLCEMACDEAVLTRKEPEHQSAYVDTIVNAALLTKAVRTSLCSPLNGGVKQMKHIKQRITLLTPFQPRRAGAGFIVLTLLLALLTGSVLADKVSAVPFSIPETGLVPVSDYMPQASYDLLMSMQTPGWEELSTEAYAMQITPQLYKLKMIFDQRFAENRFMRQLKYSVAEARNPRGDSYTVRWSTLFGRDDQAGSVGFFCDLNWKYLEDEKLTCAQRNQLLDAALTSADRAARALDITQILGAVPPKNASNELGAQLNEIAKELGGNSLSIWFTNVMIDTHLYDDNHLSREQREFIALLMPKGYRDQTAKEYQDFLKKNQDLFDQKAKEAIQGTVYKVVEEAYGEMIGIPTRFYLSTPDLSLMPAWTMRGCINYAYRLDWRTVDPDHITVGERHDAISKLITRIRDAAADAVWESKDWEAFDKALKERLPKLAQEESTPALTLTVSEVGLELWPLPTEEYMHSEPVRVLKAFARACHDQDIAQMAAVCVPIGKDQTKAGETDTREELLKSLMEMRSYYWTYGEAQKEAGKDDAATVEVNLYYPDTTGTYVQESRQAQLAQIDGKWYLIPESLQP